MSNFSKRELERYSRHLILPGFGLEAQQKLRDASVCVVGAGGLGSPVLQYLAAAGAGRITIVDFDTVSESNLQRQVLFSTHDVGKNKANVAKVKILALNPDITAIAVTKKLDSSNALQILDEAHIVIDCTDNFPTRYLVNDACVLLNKPLVYGSIFRYEGQVAVFNYKNGPNYRDLYAAPPAPGTVPSCEEGGVLGVLPGIIGCLQANEAIKIIAEIGEPLSGKLLLFDSLTLETNVVEFPDRKQRDSIKNLIDYEEFCGVAPLNNDKDMQEITVAELKALKDSNADFQLIDVREDYEYEICNIGGELISIGDIPQQIEKIDRSKKVILHCRSGSRSSNTIKWLEKNHNFTNLYNLKGGITAWADEIDPSMPKY
ncbi:MAG: molybdopterin-synthase adenylyltransferase MoeB [Cyclobacteriaceae bacterium]